MDLKNISFLSLARICHRQLKMYLSYPPLCGVDLDALEAFAKDISNCIFKLMYLSYLDALEEFANEHELGQVRAGLRHTSRSRFRPNMDTLFDTFFF